MKISLKELSDLTEKAIKSYGYNDEETEVIKNILFYAQLRGNNQGIVKLIGNGIPKREGITEMKIVKETPVSALVDGGKNHAMLVMERDTELAIEKAKESGIGMAGNFNATESTGAIGYYVSKVAKEGFIGFACAASPFELTAPYGSNKAKFCTNPIAYAVPTEEDPIILDFTTSAIAYYGLVEAKTAGKDVSEGCGYDSEGNPTVKPEEILNGAIATMAKHKGSGLAMIVQILAGPLVRADFFDTNSKNAGNLIIAIDPNIMTDKEEFVREVTRMKKEVKSARLAEGFDEILVPGERGNRMRREVEEAGEIEVEDNLLAELKKVAK
ncbi:Ldh family oxidoreductase [Candidatus Dojkabacteria bacterium]|nr:Ldh family oxidoreductase [Candidatus Dojkabacteria bacterium]